MVDTYESETIVEKLPFIPYHTAVTRSFRLIALHFQVISPLQPDSNILLTIQKNHKLNNTLSVDI